MEYISCGTYTAYMVKNAIPTYKWKLYSVHGKEGYIPTYNWKRGSYVSHYRNELIK